MKKRDFWKMIAENLDCPRCPLKGQNQVICERYTMLDEKKQPIAPCYNPEKLQELYEKEMEDD